MCTEALMATRTWWETVGKQGTYVLDQLKKLLNEGNIRRVRIRQRGRIIAEFPLTVGVVGTVFAPILAAVGAITALLTECSLEVQREAPVEAEDEVKAEPAAEPPPPDAEPPAPESEPPASPPS
jgi:hypothetical protein